MKRFIPFFFFFLLSFATYATDLHIRFGSTPYNVSNNFIPLNDKNNDNILNKSVIGAYPLSDCGTGYSLSIFKNSLTNAGYAWVNCTPTNFNLASYYSSGNAHISLVIDLGQTYYFPNMTAFRLNFTNDKTSSEVNGHDFGELTLLDSDKNIAYTTGNCYAYDFYVSDCQLRESSWASNKSYFTTPHGLSNYMNYTAFHNTTQFTSGHNVRYIVLTNAVGMVNYSIYNLDIYGVTQANNNQLPTATVQYTTPCFNSTVSYVDVPITVTCTDPEGDTCYYSDKQLSTKTETLDYYEQFMDGRDWYAGNLAPDTQWYSDSKWTYTNGTTGVEQWTGAPFLFDYTAQCDQSWYNADWFTSYLAIVQTGSLSYASRCWLNVWNGAQPIYYTYPKTGTNNQFRLIFKTSVVANVSFDLLDNTGALLYKINLNVSNHSQIWVNDIALWEDNYALYNSSEYHTIYIGNDTVMFYNESITSRVNMNWTNLNDAWFSRLRTIRLSEQDSSNFLDPKHIELYSIHMWYPGAPVELFNWTTTAPSLQRITMPDSKFHFYLTDSVHKDVNYTQIEYQILATSYCAGLGQSYLNDTTNEITDGTRDYINAIDNGASKFSFVFFGFLFILFIFLLIESHSLEVSLILSGLAGVAAAWLMTGNITQLISSASLIGMGVTLFVSKSFV